MASESFRQVPGSFLASSDLVRRPTQEPFKSYRRSMLMLPLKQFAITTKYSDSPRLPPLFVVRIW